MLMHIQLLFMHNAHTFAIFHVGYQVLQFRKYAFQQLCRFNYIVAWYVNYTTTLFCSGHGSVIGRGSPHGSERAVLDSTVLCSAFQ